MNTNATVNTRTAHGTVHRITVGRTYTSRGYAYTNGESGCGKADCGAQCSMAAKVTADPVTCPKCLAK